MVASEYGLLAKTGGLADAVAGLSEALVRRGHDVRVLLPRYSHLPPADTSARSFSDPSGQFRFLAVPRLIAMPHIYLLELAAPHLDSIYAGDERDALRFLQLCVGSLYLGEALGWVPDVLHAHDWQAALVPALSRAKAIAAPTVLTVHNMGHQGAYALRVVKGNPYADLSSWADPTARANRAVNYMRAGILSASAIATVSPTYAREIRTAEYGTGLEGVLSSRANDLTGILNGVDYAIWNPERDVFLEERFDVRHLAPKESLKRGVCAELGLDDDPARALVTVLSRLESQKGIDLLIDALPKLLRRTSANFVVHGRGRAKFASKLQRFSKKYPDRFSFTNGYDEHFAHRILAAGDMLLMPSRYEPCGLTQMYALRYGTIPVVRVTGGLADTVRQFEPDTGTGTGSVFNGTSVEELVQGVKVALGWFNEAGLWRRVVENAMSVDFSWEQPAAQYESIYRKICSNAP